MGLNIIKNSIQDLTLGENKLLNKLKDIYNDCAQEVYLYIQPKINDLIPDFIIIDPQRGVSILEVKDWGISYIRSIDKKRAKLQDREDDNPIYKTGKYLKLIQGIISSSKDSMDFIEDNIYANTVLTIYH